MIVIIIIIINIIIISDFVKHIHAKIIVISRRFGIILTPFSVRPKVFTKEFFSLCKCKNSETTSHL